MKIRDKIKLGAAVVLVIAAITEALFFYFAYQQGRALGTIQMGTDLIRREFELVMLTHDYLRNPSARAQQQWIAQHELIGTLLQRMDTADDEIREIHDSVTKTYQNNRKLFDMLTESGQAAGGGDSRPQEQFRERLGGQISVKAQSIVADMFSLSERNMARSLALERTRKIVVSGALLVLIFVFVFIVYVAWGLSRSLTRTINAVSTTSTEISATMHQHERTAARQAEMVNETSTTMDELAASSRQTHDQASAVAAVAQRASKMSGEGAATVRQAIEGMENLAGQIDAVAARIVQLGEQTAQIGGLAEMIKELSAEINMLALNAAVEAARAGEHGRGFAVVAGEVRKLAGESRKTAERANEIIGEIQKATNLTILQVDEGNKMVGAVSGYAREVDTVFGTIDQAAGTVYENAQQVLLTARQQAAAIGQVVDAMNELNTGARETAAGISQTKSGLEGLNAAAQSLTRMV